MGGKFALCCSGCIIGNPYISPIKKLDAVRKALKRIDEFTRKLGCMHPGLPHPVIGSLLVELEDQFMAALDDDLNISGAVGALFEFIKKVNPILYAGSVDLNQKK